MEEKTYKLKLPKDSKAVSCSAEISPNGEVLVHVIYRKCTPKPGDIVSGYISNKPFTGILRAMGDPVEGAAEFEVVLFGDGMLRSPYGGMVSGLHHASQDEASSLFLRLYKMVSAMSL